MSDTFRIDFPGCLRSDFARQMPAAESAVAAVVEAITQSDFSSLEEKSPGLRGLDWRQYIRSSLVRMVRTASALESLGVSGGRLLDYGSYFGHFSLMFARAGFDVSAIDSYRDYGEALQPQQDLLRRQGVTVLDFADRGRLLEGFAAESFDVVVCLGVIEHVPHTPRFLLTALDRVLTPGGCLVIETPNIAYLYRRQSLARGESVMPDIAVQYHANVPFEGHHREYTPQELVWMLGQIGHVDLHVQAYLFSLYELGTLAGRDLENFKAMVADPGMRELLLTASRKPHAPNAATPTAAADWRERLVEPEQWWFREPSLTAPAPVLDIAQETLAVHLQREVNLRDEMLARLQADMQREVALRDRMLQTLQDQVNRMSRS
jgi:2-polyprenyl-3-methyl-5-hydroxy-6-metoxy-1,4-benzoquinol methylase